jgi:hypothetical protein
MRSQLPAALRAIPLMLWLVGCDPFLMVPGGEPEGERVRPPNDWSFSDETSTIQLETRPDDPYSVNVWAVGLGPALYVHAGAHRSTWVEQMEAQPNVRVRAGEKVYELRGARVESQDEFTRVADAWEAKYGTRFRNENAAEAYLFRLERR